MTTLDAQKDEFLSQVSHELRTPMTSIRSFSEILMDGEQMSADDRQKYSQIINGEAIRLTRLLDDLLDLSVLENGQVTLNLEEGTLRDVLDRACAATDHPDVTETIQISRDRDAENVSLYTDGDRLAQVFINLITNARKYCDAAVPRLTIRAHEVEGSAVVDFTDNGSGIPEASQSLIFEKFARADDHRAAGGAGLGLAICREVMKRLGGGISYLPDRKGGAFRVVLPRNGPQEATKL